MLKVYRQQEKPHSAEFEKRETRVFEKIQFSELSLESALLICQDLHICLIADGYKLKIWHPGVVLPRAVNRVLRANTNEVLRLIGLAHVSVCPSPELHAHSWHYTVKRDCCDLCARLNHWMDKKSA